MNLYVVLYHHKHGVTPCLMRSKLEPTEEEMYAALENMGEDTEAASDDEYVEAFFMEGPQEPALNTKGCDAPTCPGWAVFNDGEIQRCDTCKRFETDDDAVAYVRALEAVDLGRHVESASHRALIELREELSTLVELCWRSAPTPKELKDELEKLLGRSFWLERHRWSEHTLQFARLLSEIYAVGEESDDTETMQEPGYLSVKISELAESMNLPWIDIMSIFERADALFQQELPGAKT